MTDVLRHGSREDQSVHRLKYFDNYWMYCHESGHSWCLEGDDFGGPLSFPVAPSAGQSVHVSCEISQRLPDGSALNLVHFGDLLTFLLTIGWIAMKFDKEIHLPLRMNGSHSGYPVPFHLASSSGQSFSLSSTLVYIQVAAKLKTQQMLAWQHTESR